MELFEEIYGSYFQAIRNILLDARKKPLSRKDIQADILSTASMESALAILPKLLEGGLEPSPSQGGGRAFFLRSW